MLHLQREKELCYYSLLSFPFLHIRFGHLDKIHLESRATQSVTRSRLEVKFFPEYIQRKQ
jgi:hypothetical protein